jgi:hypothetical protein
VVVVLVEADQVEQLRDPLAISARGAPVTSSAKATFS